MRFAPTTSGRRECHLNYDDEQNVGGISFSAVKHSGWRRLLRWLPGFNDPRIVDIPVIALDDLSLTETVSLMKLDVEGMELDALRGAHATIARFRPVIFFEQNDANAFRTPTTIWSRPDIGCSGWRRIPSIGIITAAIRKTSGGGRKPE